MTGSANKAPAVLVIGRSTINGVVVSRIVERVGLRARTETPERAAQALETDAPSIVILDLLPEDPVGAVLFERLRAQRAARAHALPAVILLSTTTDPTKIPNGVAVIDIVVARPITVDRLQPAIEAVRARNGDYG
ncbi:response regulator [Nitratireductor sp. CAU 1489]|uniref:Response regulator n=1 Tax=Nitratireductor arenosus TaxID=2682096 RepID=A0A844QPD1_9HYPH|nr:response regulator [Nitratireductor arenosus]MVA99439.1 response regulator [Nitratireductor arenosus]